MTAICPIPFAIKKENSFLSVYTHNFMAMLSQTTFGLIPNGLYFLLKVILNMTKSGAFAKSHYENRSLLFIPWTVLMISEWVKYLLNDRHWTHNMWLTCTNIQVMAIFQSSPSMLSYATNGCAGFIQSKLILVMKFSKFIMVMICQLKWYESIRHSFQCLLVYKKSITICKI